MSLYMVIENFHPGCTKAAYDRFANKGRMLPEGLLYVDSWLAKDGQRCFQLMETENSGLFTIWADKWNDLVDFDIIALGNKPN